MNPLDAFLREFALPVLTYAGYVKKARTYRLANELGDCAVVMFRAYPLGGIADFLIDVAIAPKPIVDFGEWHFGDRAGPDAFDGLWHHQWGRTREHGSTLPFQDRRPPEYSVLLAGDPPALGRCLESASGSRRLRGWAVFVSVWANAAGGWAGRG